MDRREFVKWAGTIPVVGLVAQSALVGAPPVAQAWSIREAFERHIGTCSVESCGRYVGTLDDYDKAGRPPLFGIGLFMQEVRQKIVDMTGAVAWVPRRTFDDMLVMSITYEAVRFDQGAFVLEKALACRDELRARIPNCRVHATLAGVDDFQAAMGIMGRIVFEASVEGTV